MADGTMNREQWLSDLIVRLRPLFGAHPVPEKVRVTCGWPSSRALTKARAIGECWYSEASADAAFEIFVSPVLDDAAQVAATVVHELVHAANGRPLGHKGDFVVVAKEVGLQPPWTATKPSPELAGRLNVIVGELGPYPHAKLDGMKSARKKQTARMLKILCAACGYTLRTTKKWMDHGLPLCSCGAGEMKVESVAVAGERPV